MPEDVNEDEDRTEEVSQKRLDRSREEGQLALGRDLPGAVAFVAGAAALSTLGPRAVASLVHLVAETTRTADAPVTAHAGLYLEPALLSLALLAVPVVAGAVAQLAQTGGGVWTHLALPDPERLTQSSPLRLFKGETWQDIGLSLLKIAGVLAAVWSPAEEGMRRVVSLTGAPLPSQAAGMSEAIHRAGLRVAVALVLLAGIDYGVTRWRYMKRMRMTKDEAKREMKEDEGDPLLRGRRKKRHRDLAKNRASVEVPKADVVLVNPTHIAVALRYDREKDPAPRVVAKGAGPAAERIREIARGSGVAIVQDIPLARLLFRRVKVGKTIPGATWKAVAAILAVVWKAAGRTRGVAA